MLYLEKKCKLSLHGHQEKIVDMYISVKISLNIKNKWRPEICQVSTFLNFPYKYFEEIPN